MIEFIPSFWAPFITIPQNRPWGNKRLEMNISAGELLQENVELVMENIFLLTYHIFKGIIPYPKVTYIKASAKGVEAKGIMDEKITGEIRGRGAIRKKGGPLW